MELLNLLPSYKDVLLYNRCTDTEEGGLQTTLFIPLILYAIYKGLIFLRGLYRRHLHPLRKFPGHSEACVSTAWAYSEALKGYPEETFEVLHKRYSKLTSSQYPIYYLCPSLLLLSLHPKYNC